MGQATGATVIPGASAAGVIGYTTGSTAFPWTSDRSGGFISITEIKP
jgi:hypothetical protein